MTHNVVGVLPGTPRPNETIIYSRALGSPRPLPGDRRRRHLQRRARQRDRHGRADRTRAPLRRRGPSAAFGGVHRADGGRAGPARRALLSAAPGLRAARHGRRPSTWTASTISAARATSRSSASARARWTISSRSRASAGPPRRRRIQIRKRATSIAPTTCTSRSSAFRCSTPRTASTWSTAAKRAGARLNDAYTANNYHKPSDELTPNWDMTGGAEDLDAALQRWAAARRQQSLASMARRTPNSAPRAKRRAARKTQRAAGNRRPLRLDIRGTPCAVWL